MFYIEEALSVGCINWVNQVSDFLCAYHILKKYSMGAVSIRVIYIHTLIPVGRVL